MRQICSQSCLGRDLHRPYENVCVQHSSQPVLSRQIYALLLQRSSIVHERTYEWEGALLNHVFL